MIWDFGESNPFSESSGNFFGGIETIYSVLSGIHQRTIGHAQQRDATATININNNIHPIISTDPPYYELT
ncbi:MAG: hypothetical protein M3120_02590, partial [Pseudomonadota bacterium]|nr:hypothetical protein [Pseudomonadota bacterium]